LEGALLATIAVLLVVMELLMPFLYPVLVLVRPVPFAVASFRHGLRIGTMTVVVASVVSGLIGGIMTMFVVALVSGSIGLTFGFAFRRRYSAATTLILATIVVPLALGAALGLTFLVIGINPLVQLQEVIAQSLQLTQQLYSRVGLGEQIEPGLEIIRQALDLMFTAWLPATVTIVAVTQAALNFTILREVLTRLGHEVAALPPFARWQFPYHVVWVFIAGYAASWAGPYLGQQLLSQAGENLMIITFFIFSIQGLSFAHFFFERWNFPRIMSILILITLAINPSLLQIVYYAGMFETVIQYRKTILERAAE
jgi:uncharacterized protein YybS (DUF2232 family)